MFGRQLFASSWVYFSKLVTCYAVVMPLSRRRAALPVRVTLPIKAAATIGEENSSKRVYTLGRTSGPATWFFCFLVLLQPLLRRLSRSAFSFVSVFPGSVVALTLLRPVSARVGVRPVGARFFLLVTGSSGSSGPDFCPSPGSSVARPVPGSSLGCFSNLVSPVRASP